MADATTPGGEEIETTNVEHDESEQPAGIHEHGETDELDEDEEDEDGGEA